MSNIAYSLVIFSVLFTIIVSSAPTRTIFTPEKFTCLPKKGQTPSGISYKGRSWSNCAEVEDEIATYEDLHISDLILNDNKIFRAPADHKK